MPYLNYFRREISFKVVYYGPGMSGKTTNLAYIHQALAPERRGELLMLNTDEERTLFFDYFPLELGMVEGYHVRFNMYTVPGQSYYEASRRLVLDGADGVVFVGDSQPQRIQENVDSFAQMQQNLLSYGLDLRTFPLVLQYNKRDCADPIPVGSIEARLQLEPLPVYESVATTGRGVMETIRTMTSMIIERFQT